MKETMRWTLSDRLGRRALTASSAVGGDAAGTLGAVVLNGQFLRWTKYTVAHTALQVAGLTNDVELLSLPAGGNIHAIKMRHSVAFGGGLIAGYTLSIGIGGNLIKYMAAASVFGSSAIAVSGTFGCESHSGATSIRLAAVATTGLLNSSTQGSADIWVCTSLIL